jgi:hypothetical protein
VSSCGIIIGVADPDNVPEIFEKEDFDPEAKEEDLHLQATLYALLPNAVATLQAHVKLKAEEHQAFMSLLPQPTNSKSKIGRNEPCPPGERLSRSIDESTRRREYLLKKILLKEMKNPAAETARNALAIRFKLYIFCLLVQNNLKSLLWEK